MRTKDINTLAQLRVAKANLKQEMKKADRASQDNLLVAGINLLFPNNKSEPLSVPSAWDAGTSNVIKFLASQTKRKIPYKRIFKVVVPVAMAIATPILVRKFRNKSKKIA